MAAGTLVDADAVPLILRFLRAHAAVLEQFGGDPKRIGTSTKPPFPRLVIRPSGGSPQGQTLWRTEQDMTLHVYADRAGVPGDSALRRALAVVLVALGDLPYAPVIDPQAAVVSMVAQTTPPTPLYDPARPRWMAGVRLTVHPPPVAPPPPA